MPELTVSQQTKVRHMFVDRRHPDQPEAYLASVGFSAEDVDELYRETNKRLGHLLDCYRMKRNGRLVGAVILFGALAVYWARLGCCRWG